MTNCKTVLLVEDSDMDSELIQTALDETGIAIAVVRVRDGVEALEYLSNLRLEQNPIALVLLDIKLPRMNGIELLSRLKSGNETKYLPVVMFTSSREKQDLFECYRAGANAYIVKPVEYQELLKVLRYIGCFWCRVNEQPENPETITPDDEIHPIVGIGASNEASSKIYKELELIKWIEDQAREYSGSIIDTVREPLIILDQNLRVVTAGRSFYEVFKVNPEETLGQLIYDLGNKQWDIPKLRELLETILPQKATFDNYEVEHNFTTIGKRIMLLNARQIPRVMGKERIILLAIEDITARREIENGLKKSNEELNDIAAELKRAARAKSEFLANMSHELRTPLNSINGFSEVLFDETFGPLNEKQKKYVNNVLTSGKHLLQLINQILDMAKVESGKMKLELSILPMKKISNEISLLFDDMAGKKKIVMVLDIAEDLPDIEADELKVKEVLFNLLSNAVKFTPEGGRLGLKAEKTGSGIEISVWDTGIGIAPENMEKVFEGFFRVDTPYSRVTEGTGLGLPLSRKIVELHGGKLSIESPGLNKGTRVQFVLPMKSGEVV